MTRTIFPADKPAQMVFERIDIGKIDRKRVPDAISSVSLAMVPARKETLSDALISLRYLTAGRQQEVIDIVAQTRLYVEKLRAYPADVAMTVLEKVWKFFPTWSELYEECEILVAPRRALLLRLERLRDEPELPAPEKPCLTAEQRADLAATLRNSIKMSTPSKKMWESLMSEEEFERRKAQMLAALAEDDARENGL